MNLRKEVRLGRIEMSKRKLRRVEVLARVKSKELKLTDAASLLGLSYRQDFAGGCCIWCGRSTGELWESDLGRRWQPSIWPAKTRCGSTRRRCGGGCWRKGCGAGSASANRIASGGSVGGTLASWCRWMAAFTTGWSSGVRTDA